VEKLTFIAYGIGLFFLMTMSLGSCGIASEYTPAGWLWGISIISLAVPLTIQLLLKSKWRKRHLIALYCGVHLLLLNIVTPMYHDTEDYRAHQIQKSQEVSHRVAIKQKVQLQQEEPPAIAQADLDKSIAQLKSIGFVMDLRPDENGVFIDPQQWATLTFSQREDTVYLFAAYCQYYCAVKGKVVYLKDGYSGKSLAEYGIFGPKIEPVE
jgi:hypothetical protein